MSTPGMPTSFSARPLISGPADSVGAQTRALDHLRNGAFRQELAVGDVGDLVAALGLVHVVGRDQHRHAIRRELVDLAPELAPCLRVDARRRFIEKEQIGRRKDAGAKRQALLPSARKRAGELHLPALEPEALDRLFAQHRPDRECRRSEQRTPGSP